MKRQVARISEKVSEDKRRKYDKRREEKKTKDKRGKGKEIKTIQKNCREKKVKDKRRGEQMLLGAGHVNIHCRYSCRSQQCSLPCRKIAAAVADCSSTTSGVHHDKLCRHSLTSSRPSKPTNSEVHTGTPCSDNTHVQYYLQLRLGL